MDCTCKEQDVGFLRVTEISLPSIWRLDSLGRNRPAQPWKEDTGLGLGGPEQPRPGCMPDWMILGFEWLWENVCLAGEMYRSYNCFFFFFI